MTRNLILLISAVLLAFAAACGGGESSSASTSGEKPKPKSMMADKKPADEGKGVGEITHVDLNTPLDTSMISKGEAIYDMKCSACHKLSTQRVVGPGWKGVTERRKPEWIMNMTTNVDIMLEEDAAAQALLKECLVRMPNQNLNVGDARNVLEFMFANDQKGE